MIPNLFLFVCVTNPLILARLHRLGHFPQHGNAMAILEGPHAVQIEESHAVVIFQRMIEIRLKVGHGAQLPVDERDAAPLGRHLQNSQKVADRTPFGQFDFWVGMTAAILLATITRQFAIQPDIHKNIRHSASSNRWEYAHFIAVFEPAIGLLNNSIYERDASLSGWNPKLVDKIEQSRLVG